MISQNDDEVFVFPRLYEMVKNELLKSHIRIRIGA